MKIALALVLLVAAGCGGGAPDCVQRSGTMRINMTARSGNCGAVAETIETMQSQPTAPPPPCTGSISYSPDNCEVTVDTICPVGTDGATNKMVGKADWAHDGKAGTAVLDIRMTSGSGVVTCSGTYDVQYTKL